ncbi:MAG: hypothetical protein DCC65_07865 [Planctomycetota bacterium]|nr:MAG: hypothetical protein DCC65_07865 [Planctomycetota bacterium]
MYSRKSSAALRRLTIVTVCGPLLLSARYAHAQSAEAKDRAQAESREAERQRRQREAEDARTKQLIERFSASVKDTSALLQKLEDRVAVLDKQTQDLLTNDDGKRLAQDKLAFFAYLRVREEPIASLEQVRARKEQADAILQTLEAELKRVNVGWLPDETQRRDVDGLYFWGRDRLEQIERQEALLANAIARSPKEANLSEAKTLDVVIREYEARQMESWLAAKVQGAESAQAEGREKIRESARIAELEKAALEAERLLKEERAKLASMKAEYELMLQKRETEEYKRRVETETKLRDLAAEVDRLKQMADAQRFAKDAEAKGEVAKTMSEAQKQLLIQKCNDPEVRRILAPFLAEGYTQPGLSGQQPDRVPISLNRLAGFGALNPDKRGMCQLIIVATWKVDKVRPRWPVPVDFDRLTPEQIEMVKKAQQLLIELGPILVEQKMLSP